MISEQGAQNPGHRDDRNLQRLDPISQNSEDAEESDEDPGADGPEEFVDAQGSQVADGDGRPAEEHANEGQTRLTARRFGADAGAILAPIANYWRSQRTGTNAPQDTTTQWQRRVESALVKMNAEVAALREQLEMQQDVAMHSSILRQFTLRGHNRSFAHWALGSMFSFAWTVVKHLFVDATLIALITLFMHYRGIPLERLEQTISRNIEKVRQLALLRRLEKSARNSNIKLPDAVQKTLVMRPARNRGG